MKREEVTQKQENPLSSLEPYQNYRTLFLVDEEENEQWQKWNHSVKSEEMHTLTLDSKYKDILFGSQKSKKEWQKKITQILLSDRIPSETVLRNSGTDLCKDVSEEKDASILGWVEKVGETESEYILHLDADGTILAPAKSSGLFGKFSNVKTIDWGNCFDTKNVTDMCGMFRGCKKLENLDVSHFDTQNVTDMSWMFFSCKKLENLDVSHFDTRNVIDMGGMCGMFSGCEKLERLDVSHFDTQNVTDMSWMFQGCKKLENLDVSHFDTQNVIDMSGMFSECKKLENLDVSHFDTQNVTDIHGMFSGCKKLERLDVSHFDTQNVTDMSWMFCMCEKLERLDVSGFDTQNVMDMKFMFRKCKRLEYLDVSGFDTQNVTNMYGMFSKCTKLERLDVSGFDTRNVTSMRKMFYECTNLTSLNVSRFDLRKVTGIFRMFAGCTNLEKLDVDRFAADCPSLWFHTLDTDYASILFASPQSNEKWRKRITQIILSDRIPSESALRNSGTDIYKDVSEAKDHSILGWVEKDGNDYILHLDADGTILALRNSKCLFAGFSKVKTIEWKDCFDTRNVKNMSSIFGRCSNLTKLDVSGLDTHNVTDMSFMFKEMKTSI